MNNIAILITCFNRKEKTIACLRQVVNNSRGLKNFIVKIYLVDDGSTDGTSFAIEEEFPFINIINGSGNLFWAGGMRLAWETSRNFGEHDYYLLLNDDTILITDAFQILLNSNKKIKAQTLEEGITIGTTIDQDSGSISYGGSLLINKLSPKSVKVFNENVEASCDLGNANIMLVPKAIVEKIGTLSNRYTHGLADFDFTIRAKKNGFWVMVAPKICGYCKNDHGKRWKGIDTKLSKRIEFLYSPKGLAYNEYLYFIKTYFPLSYPILVVKLWTKTLFPFIYDWLKK